MFLYFIIFYYIVFNFIFMSCLYYIYLVIFYFSVFISYILLYVILFCSRCWDMGNVPKHQCGERSQASMWWSPECSGDGGLRRRATSGGARCMVYYIAGASSGDAQRVLRAGANSGGEMRVCDIRGRQSGGVRCWWKII